MAAPNSGTIPLEIPCNTPLYEYCEWPRASSWRSYPAQRPACLDGQGLVLAGSFRQLPITHFTFLPVLEGTHPNPPPLPFFTPAQSTFPSANPLIFFSPNPPSPHRQPRPGILSTPARERLHAFSFLNSPSPFARSSCLLTTEVPNRFNRSDDFFFTPLHEGAREFLLVGSLAHIPSISRVPRFFCPTPYPSRHCSLLLRGDFGMWQLVQRLSGLLILVIKS